MHNITRNRLLRGKGLGVVSCMLFSHACGGQTDASDNSSAVGGDVTESAGGASGANGEGGTSDAGTDSGEAGTGVGGTKEACVTLENDITAPRYLIELVVEASDSMLELMPNTDVTRWDYVRDNLERYIEGLNYTVQLGLIVFPSTGQCSGAAVSVPAAPISDEHKARLISELGRVEPGGGEPLTSAFEQALTDVRSLDFRGILQMLIIVDNLPIATSSCPDEGSITDLKELVVAADEEVPNSRTLLFSLQSTEDDIEHSTGASAIDCSQAQPTTCEGTASLGERMLMEWSQDPTRGPKDITCDVDIPPPPEGRVYDTTKLTQTVVLSGEAQTLIECVGPQTIRTDPVTGNLVATLCFDACAVAFDLHNNEDGTRTTELYCL
jgi:hypothetical protein